jgi:hypothetical protein
VLFQGHLRCSSSSSSSSSSSCSQILFHTRRGGVKDLVFPPFPFPLACTLTRHLFVFCSPLFFSRPLPSPPPSFVSLSFSPLSPSISQFELLAIKGILVFQVCVVGYYASNIIIAFIRAVAGWNPKTGGPFPGVLSSRVCLPASLSLRLPCMAADGLCFVQMANRCKEDEAVAGDLGGS